jgi:cytoskeleton protein RodZ
MSVFGDRLRREREMRGVTLDEISESTKISRRALQALEEEEFNLLPGGIFNKGFVRSYARYLGIDEEQAVSDYVEASHEQAPPEDQFPLEINEENTQRKPPLNPKRSVTPIALAIIALAIGVGGWSYWVKFRPLQLARSEPTRDASGMRSAAPPAQKASVAPPAPARTDAGKTSASESQVQSPPVGTASPALPEGSKPATAHPDAQSSTDDPSDSKTQSTEGLDASAPEITQPNSRFTVSVKALEASYVRIVADGKTVSDGLMEANKERSVKAGKELVLRVGNAAGIEVSYQGKPLGPLGEEGKPRTLTFNSAGLQQ